MQGKGGGERGREEGRVEGRRDGFGDLYCKDMEWREGGREGGREDKRVILIDLSAIIRESVSQSGRPCTGRNRRTSH